MAKRKINKVGLTCCALCTVLGFGLGWTVEPLHPAEKKEDVKTTYIDVPLSQGMQIHISELCADNNVPVALAYSIIDHESNFNADAESDTADYGLMQINAIMRQEVGEDVDLLNPYQNVKVGIELLGKYWEETEGDVNKVAMMYNMGVTGARKAWSDKVHSTKYSKSVVSNYEMYEDMLNAK